MTIHDIETFKLLDGTDIPWLAWGNGSGEASKKAVECGQLALAAGIPHLDTAQLYKNEKETGEAINLANAPREQVYVTSKIGPQENGDPLPLQHIASSVESSISKLGFVPDLYLIHNPFVIPSGQLKAAWKILEDLKDAGKLKSIGVSNFRPQDLEAILDGAKYKPVVNQLEYHPYTLSHLEPVLALQKKHGILTESYGPLTPVLRHPTGGPLKPVLGRISARISSVVGKPLNSNVVLLLWTRAQGAIAVTTSSNPERITALGEIATLPNL